MTKAVCFSCGSIKWGSLTRCENCRATPVSDEELLQSLVLSDHYFDAKQLDEFGKGIASGVKMKIEQSFADQLQPVVQRMKPRLKLNRQAARRIDENGRHFLHEFMTGQRPQRRANKRINRTLWTIILLLLGLLLYVLIHG
jgi:hypothetical protein